MLLGSSTCSAFRLLFPFIRFSCHSVGAFFFGLLFYSRLHSALMFFIRLCAMRFLQICAGFGSFCFSMLLFMVSAFYFVIAWNVIYLTFFLTQILLCFWLCCWWREMLVFPMLRGMLLININFLSPCFCS